MNSKNSISKKLILGASVLSIMAATASATITFDLRASASSGTITNNGKSVAVSTGANTVTLQIWATVTKTDGTSTNPFGIQSVMGSIKSASVNPGDADGSVSTVTLPSYFNAASQVGTAAQLTTPTADGIIDLGSNATSAQLAHVKSRHDPTAGGTQVGTAFYVTNKDTTNIGGPTQLAGLTEGVSMNTLTLNQSYEFLMGTATLSLTSFSSTPGAQVTMNWAMLAATTVGNRNNIAAWTDGDNLGNLGGANFAEIVPAGGSTAGIVITLIPEPSAFGMVLIGALGLVGFRRLGFRRNS